MGGGIVGRDTSKEERRLVSGGRSLESSFGPRPNNSMSTTVVPKSEEAGPRQPPGFDLSIQWLALWGEGPETLSQEPEMPIAQVSAPAHVRGRRVERTQPQPAPMGTHCQEHHTGCWEGTGARQSR